MLFMVYRIDVESFYSQTHTNIQRKLHPKLSLVADCAQGYHESCFLRS